MNRDQLILRYREIRPSLTNPVVALDAKLQSVLSVDSLKLYSIASRIKTEESLKKKIERPDRTYLHLEQVTDIVGFRVITYFEDSIEELGRLIEKNFSVDYENSTNKLRTSDHERFGYRSMHYVCSDQTLGEVKFEIQIRTVLQHAWAEIEHDLGYKSIEGVPGIIRRRFSQISSILEIADREFVAIRHDVNNYESKIKALQLEKDSTIPLDLVTLKSILEHPTVSALDRELATILGQKLDTNDFYPDYVLRVLAAADLNSAKDTLDAIDRHHADFGKFVKPYFEFTKGVWNFEVKALAQIQRGYSLLFIAHLVMLAREPLAIDKVNEAIQFYRKIDYHDAPAEAARVGRRLVESLETSGYFKDEA